jgi:hypothetical protein
MATVPTNMVIWMAPNTVKKDKAPDEIPFDPLPGPT